MRCSQYDYHRAPEVEESELIHSSHRRRQLCSGFDFLSLRPKHLAGVDWPVEQFVSNSSLYSFLSVFCSLLVVLPARYRNPSHPWISLARKVPSHHHRQTTFTSMASKTMPTFKDPFKTLSLRRTVDILQSLDPCDQMSILNLRMCTNITGQICLTKHKSKNCTLHVSADTRSHGKHPPGFTSPSR